MTEARPGPCFLHLIFNLLFMKRLFKVCLLMLFALALSCDPGTTELDAPDDLLIAEAKTTSKQTVDILDGTDEDFPVVGTSTLHRNANGITVNYKAEGLIPGHTYTLWWVVWNYPYNCIGTGTPEEPIPPCNEPDFGNPDGVGVDVLYAGGHLAGNSGKVNISAHLNEGDTKESIRELFQLGAPIGLLDAQTAEIHPVLRSHGPAIPGLVNEQISSYLGGCEVFFDVFTEVPELPGECGDIYFAIHEAE